MAVINKEIAYMALPLSIRRGNPFPVDETSVWYDKSLMETYARENAVAYVGQVLVYVNEDLQTTEAYVIQNAGGTLMKLASTTASGDLTADIQSLQGKVSALEVSVEALEATVAEIETEIGEKGEDNDITATNLWSAIKEIRDAYKAADLVIDGKFANYYDKSATDNQIDTKIATAISSAYKAAGSIDFEDLPEAGTTEEGKVYNILTAFTTDDTFVEGAGSKYPIGTNVVCIEVTDSIYKWDVLAGFVDLTDYAKTADVNVELDKKIDKVEGSSLVEDTDIAKLKGLYEIKNISGTELEITGDKVLGIKAVEQSKVTGLSEALGNKVDKADGKELVDTTLIDKLNGIANIKTVGDGLNLDGSGNLTVSTISQDKVDGLPDALAEKLTGVTVGTTPMEVVDGVVTIPVATSETLGVVKSNAVENGVVVNEQGTMAIHSVNVNKLVQTEGEELILNGGGTNLE